MLFHLMYKYHSKICYEVENNFSEEKISSAKNRVEQLQNFRKNFKKRLKKIAKYQTKFYNSNHKLKKFVVDKLILLFIKNLNQKRWNKKIFFKFAKLFWIEKKVEKQTYCLTLLFTYRIHNVFYVFYWNHIIIKLTTKMRISLCKF